MQKDAFVLRASDLYFIESKKVKSFLVDLFKVLISLIIKFFLIFKLGNKEEKDTFFFFFKKNN